MDADLEHLDSADQWEADKRERRHHDGRTRRRIGGALLQRYLRSSTLEITSSESDKFTGLQPHVTYSLNKDGRWSLPAILKRFIAQSSGDEHISAAMLERVSLSSHQDANAGVVGYYSTAEGSRENERGRCMNAASVVNERAAVCYEVHRPISKKQVTSEKNSKRVRSAGQTGGNARGKRGGKVGITVDEAMEDFGEEWCEEDETEQDAQSYRDKSGEMSFSSLVSELQPKRTDTESLSRGCESIPRECYVSAETMALDWLLQEYGDRYEEGSSEPRRFAVDVTDAFRESSIEVNHVDADHADLYNWAAVVVFEECSTQDTDGFVRVRVWPQVCLTCNSVSIESIDDSTVYSTSAVVAAAVQHLAQVCWTSLEKADPATMSYRHSATQLEWCKPVPSSQREEESRRGEPKRGGLVRSSAEQVQINTCEFCQIQCAETADAGALLRECRHWFCNECWTEHLKQAVANSSEGIRCPASDCDAAVDHVTLLRYVSMHEYLTYGKRCQIAPGAKECPSANCGCLVSGGSDALSRAFVKCKCDRELCLDCLGAPHWPATCDQAEVYHRKVASIVDLKPDLAESEWLQLAIQHRRLRSARCWADIVERTYQNLEKFEATPARSQSDASEALGKPDLQRFEEIKKTLFARRDERMQLQTAVDDLLEQCQLFHFIVEYAAVRFDAGQFKDSATRAQFVDAYDTIKLAADQLVDLLCSEEAVQLERLERLADGALKALRCMNQLTTSLSPPS